jgi:hypothetical protein
MLQRVSLKVECYMRVNRSKMAKGQEGIRTRDTDLKIQTKVSVLVIRFSIKMNQHRIFRLCL